MRYRLEIGGGFVQRGMCDLDVEMSKYVSYDSKEASEFVWPSYCKYLWPRSLLIATVTHDNGASISNFMMVYTCMMMIYFLTDD